MSNPTTEGATPGTEEVIDLDEHAERRARADDDDDEAAQDDPEVLAGMMAGFKAVSGNDDIPDTLQGASTEGKKRFGGGSDTSDPDDDDAGDGGEEGPNAGGTEGDRGAGDDDNRVVFGGMTAKQLREKLEKTDSLERTTQTLAGRVGSLQSQIQAAGKPRALTKDDFPSLREEFGDEYAEAVARDLSKVVTGGPSTSKEDVEREVAARVDVIARQTERKLVRMAHPDAADYFAGGAQHEAFMGWVQQLPQERREVLLNTWDSDDIIPALADFKNSVSKAAKEAAAKGNRISRSVAGGNTGTADGPKTPEIDPIELGWRKARGKPTQGQMRVSRH